MQSRNSTAVVPFGTASDRHAGNGAHPISLVSPSTRDGVPRFDADLIRRYDGHGPRYTSYPTAAQFTEDFDVGRYRQAARATNELFIPAPISLYVHIPFCATVCYYCACNKIVTANRQHADRYLDYLEKEIALHAELYDPDRRVTQLHFGGGTPPSMARCLYRRPTPTSPRTSGCVPRKTTRGSPSW